MLKWYRENPYAFYTDFPSVNIFCNQWNYQSLETLTDTIQLTNLHTLFKFCQFFLAFQWPWLRGRGLALVICRTSLIFCLSDVFSHNKVMHFGQECSRYDAVTFSVYHIRGCTVWICLILVILIWIAWLRWYLPGFSTVKLTTFPSWRLPYNFMIVIFYLN